MFESMGMYDLRDAPNSTLPASQRAWTRRRPHYEARPFHFLSHTDVHNPQMMRDYSGYDHEPLGFGSRIEELTEVDAPTTFQSPITQSPHRSILRQGLQAQRIQFPEAARAMHAALVCADQECRNIAASFASEIRDVLVWLPPSYVKSLWTIRLSWNGRLQQDASTADKKTRTESPNLITYDGISQRFNAALMAIRNCSPPDRRSFSGDRVPTMSLGWEVLGSTMRKLRISFEAIEELLVLVKAQRDKLPLLLHEIASAQHLLESVREVWESLNKAGKRPDTTNPTSSAPASASSSAQTRRTEYAWSRYSSMNERYDDAGIEI
ncbi:hypothetical protein Slin14017_G061980 [Septoria linicola]|nr:hypothetical protein Slin14017_G061980 [Septoria linicola]